MRVLGAVLAGGQSTRFGSDKALAMLDGKTLIAHAVEALAGRADLVLVCGRPWSDLAWVEDRPTGGGGPLTGLNAALRFADQHGFDAVLCAPIDVYPLPAALRLLTGARCAVLRTQWAVGLWPIALGPALDLHLASGARSIRSWLGAVDVARIADEHLGLRNINTSSDLPSSPPD
jgi:molybdopterin-guanine dinucleotide biosynthesis protein A